MADRRWPSLLRRALATALGVLLPVALVALYFRSHGALSDAYLWGIAFNRSYIGEGPGIAWALQRLAAQLAGVVLPAAVLWLAGIAALAGLARRKPQDDVLAARAFLVLWTVLSLAAVAAGSRFFGHYFLQAEVPLSLLAARGGPPPFPAPPPRSPPFPSA